MQGLYATYRRARDSSAMAIPLQGVTTGKRASEIHRLLHKYKGRSHYRKKASAIQTGTYMQNEKATAMKRATEVHRLAHKYKRKELLQRQGQLKYRLEDTYKKEEATRNQTYEEKKNLADKMQRMSHPRDTKAHLVWKAAWWGELEATGLER